MKSTDRYNVHVQSVERKYTTDSAGVCHEETFARTVREYSMVPEPIRAAIQSELIACLERLDEMSKQGGKAKV